MNEHFSPRRCWMLLRADFLDAQFPGGYRGVGGVAVFATVYIFGASLIADSSSFEGSSFHTRYFGLVLVACGIFASSMACDPFHRRPVQEAFLLLPASILEKVLSRILVTTVGVTVVVLVLITVISLVGETFNLLHYGHRRPFFNPFEPAVWKWIAVHIVVQSVYFLGAAWFRRLSVLKTTLVLILILSALAMPFMFLVLAERADLGWGAGFLGLFVAGFVVIVRGLFANPLAALIVVPPALWWIAWRRLRKVQADDGV